MTWQLEGRLERCLLLALRTPAESVEPLLPVGLRAISFRGYAFWHVVMCRVAQMRPRGWPAGVGFSFHHVAYRLLVAATDAQGNTHEGLYFVRSDADHPLVATLGRSMTDLRFHTARIDSHADTLSVGYDVTGTRRGIADAGVRVVRGSEPGLCADSCFDDLDQMDHWLHYRCVALAPDGRGRLSVLRVERDMAAWREHPVMPAKVKLNFLDTLGQTRTHLEQAWEIEPIAYRWVLGESMPLRADVTAAAAGSLTRFWSL
jgi:hypothetical protein